MSPSSTQDDYTPPADLKTRLAASYDILAPTYNAWILPTSNPRLPWLQKMLVNLPANFTAETGGNSQTTRLEVLELGAGAGIPTTQAILDHSSDIYVHANDLSPIQLGLLQSNLSTYASRITLLPGDMLNLTPTPGSLAAVAGMYSLIHLPSSEQSELLQKISTWLSPGGFLLANFPAEEVREDIIEDWLGVAGAWVYWSGLGVKGTLKAVGRAGLEILESDVVGGEGVDADFLWVLARKPLD